MTRRAAGIMVQARFRTDRAVNVRALVLIGVFSSSPAWAQTWRVIPSISVTETLTDNVALAPSDSKQSDLITQITPGIRIEGKSARAQLSLDYRMNQILYANQSSGNNRQNYLSASGTLEAIDKWLFVEASANISQQTISAFGSQPTLNGNINSNRAETRTYRLSPYIKGQIGSMADYQLRYDWTTTSANETQFATTQVEQWLGIINGRTGFSALGWSLNASSVVAHRDPLPDSESARAGGSLIYQLTPEIRTTALAGFERSNYTGVKSETSPTYGGRIEWTPTPRTQVTAYKEKRQFGNSHEFSLTHRTPRTAWQLSDRKDVTTLANQLSVVSQGTVYDLLYNVFATAIPDPTLRAQHVERLLRQNSIPANLELATAFLTTSVFVQRTQQASVAVIGARNVLTLAAARTESNSLTSGATPDAFGLSPQIEQRSLSASLAHQLSGLSTATLAANQVRSKGTGATSVESTQSALTLVLTHRIGPRTSGSVAVRTVHFDSSNGPGYRENAIIASVNMTFF